MFTALIAAVWRVFDALLDALAVLASLLILALMVGVALDVIGRYFLGSPISWMFEVTEYTLLYIPCLGMAWLARERGHVAIDIVVGQLPVRLQRALGRAVALVVALVCAFIAYWSVVVTVDGYRQEHVLEHMIRIPEFVVIGVIPLGFTLTAIAFARLSLGAAPADGPPSPSQGARV